MTQRKRTRSGDQIGVFTVLDVGDRRAVPGKGTTVRWRARCGECGNENYLATVGDLRRNRSCGCVPQGRWTGPRSDEYKKKVSASLTGKRRGSDNPNWKGDDAGYYAMHAYAGRTFDRVACEHCGEAKSRLEWATKHGRKPSRVRGDWLCLCVRCHRFYDDNPLATGRYWQERKANSTGG